MTLMRVGREESVMGVQALNRGTRYGLHIPGFIRDHREGFAAWRQCRGPACLVNVKGLDVFPCGAFVSWPLFFPFPGKLVDDVADHFSGPVGGKVIVVAVH